MATIAVSTRASRGSPGLGVSSILPAAVRSAAERLGTLPSQIALAWLLALAPNVLLIPGTSSVEHLEQNLAAAEIALDDEALAGLNEERLRDAG